jgi:dTDP-4-amino-4,6-dideoxygalactose transaminase
MVAPLKITFTADDIQLINQQIAEVLASGQLTQGSHVREFEQLFAQSVQAPFAVAVSSGTAALEICLRTLGVDGKEVIVPTNTFFATPAAVIHAGGRPRFVDVDRSTFAIRLADLEHELTADTAGIIVVYIGSIIPGYLEELSSFCDRHGLFLLEDCAHAHGCFLHGRAAGTFGVAGTYSFYPTKTITSAEGGMIVTSDERLSEQARRYRDQGKLDASQNLHVCLGHNWRMSELHAVLGKVQLSHLAEFVERRTAIAERYFEALSAIPELGVARPPAAQICGYYKVIALLPRGIDRDEFKARMKKKFGVSLGGEVYAIPCHAQPVFQAYTPRRPLSTADDICARHICLPIYPFMTEAEQQLVLHALKDTLDAMG